HLWRTGQVNRLRLEQVFVVADDPVQAAVRWARFGALLPSPHRGGAILKTARGFVFIATREIVAGILGDAPPAPAIGGYSLRTRNPKAFAKRCRNAGLEVKGDRVKLPPALGGCWRLR